MAAWTASPSALSWTPSSRSRPSSTMSPKSPLGAGRGRDGRGVLCAPTCGATYGVKPTASIPETLIRHVRSGGRRVDVLRVLGDLHRGLEAALGHDQLGHLAGQVDVGGTDHAVLVGQRVVRGVGEDALGAAERDAGDLDAAVGAWPARRPSAPGRRSGRCEVTLLTLAMLLAERVEPGLVHAQAGAGDAQHVEGAHHCPPPRS